MKTEVIKCDFCQKTITDIMHDYTKLTLPILTALPDGTQSLKATEVEFCLSCTRKLANFYYSECERRGFSGIRAITCEVEP